jgi:hypothetical protein
LIAHRPIHRRQRIAQPIPNHERTNATTENFTLDTAVAQKRSEIVRLRDKTQNQQPMKTLKVIFLLVLLAVATTALVQAQTTEPFTLTTSRVVSNGSSSSSGDVNSASSAIRKLFTCAKNLNISNR